MTADDIRIQIASDIVRDGLGVELIDESGTVLAEVFRCDAARTVVVTTFENDISLQAVERLLAVVTVRDFTCTALPVSLSKIRRSSPSSSATGRNGDRRPFDSP